jgi:hypothetical protein
LRDRRRERKNGKQKRKTGKIKEELRLRKVEKKNETRK